MSDPVILKSSSRHWPWVLALAVGIGGGYFGWRHEQSGENGATHSAALSPAPQGLWPSGGPGGAGGDAAPGQPLIPKEPVGESRPADFSEADWDALNKALEHEPDKARERQRLVSYLRFQRAAAQWSEMKDGPDVARRQALGREIVAQLPEHVANGEVNAGEAIVLLTAIGEDLEPDMARRKTWMETQQARLQGTQTDAQAKALAEEKRKNEEFGRLQAEVVAKWQAAPAAERDPAVLERQLQALREKVYATSP